MCHHLPMLTRTLCSCLQMKAYKVMVGCYEIWRTAASGLFYDLDVVGSDIECHPELMMLKHVMFRRIYMPLN